MIKVYRNLDESYTAQCGDVNFTNTNKFLVTEFIMKKMSTDLTSGCYTIEGSDLYTKFEDIESYDSGIITNMTMYERKTNRVVFPMKRHRIENNVLDLFVRYSVTDDEEMYEK